MKGVKIILIPLLMFGIAACSNSHKDIMNHSEYVKWFTSNESFQKSRNISHFRLTAVNNPSELLAFKEVISGGIRRDQNTFDSLLLDYKSGIHFTLFFEQTSDEFGATNLLTYQAEDYLAYKERVHHLNFKINDFINLEYDGNNINPVLSHFEANNELSRRIAFHLVFPRNEFLKEGSKVKLTFKDPFWDTGTSHFTFQVDDLLNTPQLTI